MGHSIQEINGRHLPLNDLDLLAVVSLANTIAEAGGGDRFGKIVSAWNAAVEKSGPGTIDLGLGGKVETGPLRELLADVRQKASSFGETIPAQDLQRWGGVSFKDYPVHLVVETVRAIERFVG
jgi:hypothetical protein